MRIRKKHNTRRTACGCPYKVFLLFAMSVTVSLPPVAPPLASETAVSQSGGPITPTSDQVSPYPPEQLQLSNSSWGQVVVLYVVCCVISHFIYFFILLPDRSNGSYYLRLLERSRHSEFHQPSQTFHYRLA